MLKDCLVNGLAAVRPQIFFKATRRTIVRWLTAPFGRPGGLPDLPLRKRYLTGGGLRPLAETIALTIVLLFQKLTA